jgi:hypothetical protein
LNLDVLFSMEDTVIFCQEKLCKHIKSGVLAWRNSVETRIKKVPKFSHSRISLSLSVDEAMIDEATKGEFEFRRFVEPGCVMANRVSVKGKERGENEKTCSR